MSYVMQIKIDDRWTSIKGTGLPEPYKYETKQEAENMLDTCYPDLCRDDRVSGTREKTRVIEEERT